MGGSHAGRAWLLWLLLLVPLAARAFGFDDVAERARVLAEAAYKTPISQLPAELRDLDYDAYRDIRFKPDHALWRDRGVPFEIMFYHLGRTYQLPVRVNTVAANAVEPVQFDPAMFDYGRNKLDPQKQGGLGFAGFRIHYAINKPGYKDEIAVFLGASYFRAVGKNQIYGLSARGLAVDVAQPHGEEFPRFTEFWLVQPKKNATSLTLYALLDSPRVAGAYRFVITPGKETTMDIKVRLFVRGGAPRLGLAPVNSMYAFGENQPSPGDYRPEVHDSDGLSVETGDGEWIWRPFVNPKRLLVTSFSTTNPRGFGMMQRDRAPSSYEDPEALYLRRPSGWIEPHGGWQAGRVELVQIPTPDETNDNIVAYWVPDKAPQPKQPFDYSYELRWQMEGQTTPTGRAWVRQSRRGHGPVKLPPDQIQFVVDFDGPALRALGPDAKLKPTVAVGGNAELKEENLFRDQVTGAWRLIVHFRRVDAAKPAELRAYLDSASGERITETWSYIVPPESEKP